MRKSGRFANLSCFDERFTTAFYYLSTGRTGRKKRTAFTGSAFGGFWGYKINKIIGLVRVSFFVLIV